MRSLNDRPTDKLDNDEDKVTNRSIETTERKPTDRELSLMRRVQCLKAQLAEIQRNMGPTEISDHKTSPADIAEKSAQMNESDKENRAVTREAETGTSEDQLEEAVSEGGDEITKTSEEDIYFDNGSDLETKIGQSKIVVLPLKDFPNDLPILADEDVPHRPSSHTDSILSPTRASIQVLGDTIIVSQPTVSRVVFRVSVLLARLFKQFIKMPVTPDATRENHKLFRDIGRRNGGIDLPGIDGAIDCTQVRLVHTRFQNIDEVYKNRKGYFSLNVQAVVGPRTEFLDIVPEWPGSQHDSRIFQNSRLYIYDIHSRSIIRRFSRRCWISLSTIPFNSSFESTDR
ncbi:hypothetical protein DBV15_11506 [Temnothorax longispinosus]|uniref:DDE Tnp4 domain-containing protein n=1 Tax=Temnothorax longispinosus TaxID=300112 RepID=A0A4S2KW81_9HYME|nr:hypothetical protein DBV15_11506 [Temnothorax longispinosus]